MELNYFSFGKFIDPLPSKKNSLIEKRGNNLPPSLRSSFDAADHFFKIYNHADKFHFYKRPYFNSRGDQYFLYCIPEFKEQIISEYYHGKHGLSMWSHLCDNTIYYHPSIIGKTDYNYWTNIPENNDPIFVLIAGEKNMIRYAERVDWLNNL